MKALTGNRLGDGETVFWKVRQIFFSLTPPPPASDAATCWFWSLAAKAGVPATIARAAADVKIILKLIHFLLVSSSLPQE